MPFKILSHTSELKIKVKAKTKKELFKEAVNALALLLWENEKTKKEKKYLLKQFTVKSDTKLDKENEVVFLINLLNKILAHSYISKRVYFFKNFKKFSSQEIVLVCKAIKVKKFKNDIKALTFHQSQIKKINKNWEINLIFDI